MPRWKATQTRPPDRLKPEGRNRKVTAYPEPDLREWLEAQVAAGKKQDPNWGMSKQVLHLLRIARRELDKPIADRIPPIADPFLDRVAAIMREHEVSRSTARRLARAELTAARRN